MEMNLRKKGAKSDEKMLVTDVLPDNMTFTLALLFNIKPKM